MLRLQGAAAVHHVQLRARVQVMHLQLQLQVQRSCLLEPPTPLCDKCRILVQEAMAAEKAADALPDEENLQRDTLGDDDDDGGDQVRVVGNAPACDKDLLSQHISSLSITKLLTAPESLPF